MQVELRKYLVQILLIAALAAVVVPWPGRAASANGVPESPAAPLLAATGGADPCAGGALSVPLNLTDAVSRALCANPKTRGAWVQIKLYAAEVRTVKESYLPSLGLSAAETESSTRTILNDEPELNTDARANYPQGRVALNWVLYDFGQRGNQLESARQLLAAARANLDLNLQQVFLLAAADYYGTQAAHASLDAATQVEDLAQRSLSVAHARVDRGVAPVSDQLQAQTAHAEAVLLRVKADVDLKSKRGALALDMGLSPDIQLTLPPADSNITTVPPGFNEALRQLIEEAQRNHPSILAARSELAAAKADERTARDRGYPTISLVGNISRSNQPLAPSLGSPSIPGSVSNKSIGLEIDVPISDPLWKRGTIAQARAHVEIQQEALYGAEQKVAEDVWDSYTQLQADTENLANSQALFDSARASFDATQRRYEGGAGSILELLNAQSAYANAQQRRIQSLSDWRIARLALGASLGKLGLGSLEAPQ